MAFRNSSSIVCMKRKRTEQAEAPRVLLHHSLKDSIIGQYRRRLPTVERLQRSSVIFYDQSASLRKMLAECF